MSGITPNDVREALSDYERITSIDVKTRDDGVVKGVQVDYVGTEQNLGLEVGKQFTVEDSLPGEGESVIEARLTPLPHAF